MFSYKILRVLFITLLIIGSYAFISHDGHNTTVKTLVVTATAYNDLPNQTTAINPSITAWGDTLKEGMKVIAISRDLLDSGLHYNSAVYIPALNDTFYVKDKMHHRWNNKIDIYMGKDVQKALQWGKRKVTIKWERE